MYGSHQQGHAVAPTPPAPVAANASRQRIPKIDRPELKLDTTDEDWATFEAEWKRFKRCTHVPNDEIADQLFQCCERSLGRLLLKENPNVIESGEIVLLEAMRKMAVIRIAKSVRRANLLTLKQDIGESYREYYANVRASAATCSYSVKCTNDCCENKPKIDYTPSVVKDVIIAGIADSEIKKDLVGWSELDNKSDREVVGFVEEKEIARNAVSGTTSALAAMSGYRRQQRNLLSESANKLQTKADPKALDEKKKLSQKGKCLVCKLEIALYRKFRNGHINKEPFTMCQPCFKASKSVEAAGTAANGDAEAAAVVSFLTSIEVVESCNSDESSLCAPGDQVTALPTIKASECICALSSSSAPCDRRTTDYPRI